MHQKRSFALAGLICLSLVATFGASGFCDEEKASNKNVVNKYSPMLGIAAESDPFFPSRIDTSTGAAVSSSQFSDPEECKTCHPEILQQWKGSMHSNAWNDPLFRGLERIASKETNGLTDKLCLGCHTPVGVISAEDPYAEVPNFSKVASMGVFCDFCHTVSKTNGVGNLPAVSEPGDVKRGPFNDSVSPFHETSFSEKHTSPEFCGLCHNVSHPLNGLAIEQTYTEWLNGPYRAEGVICQDCHMTPPNPPTAFTKNPGKACIMGPEREHWWTHQFVGGNAFVTKLLGSKVHSEYAEKRLKAAAEIEIIPPESISPPVLLNFKVKVSNVGCGHYLPTGLTETREMWLDVKVFDRDGKELYRSGSLNKEGEIDEDAVIYHTVIGNEEGKPTWKVWEATRVLYDYRIPPKGYRIEYYSAYLHEDTKLPIKIQATLNYRSVSPHLAKELLNNDVPEIPTVKMNEAEIILK